MPSPLIDPLDPGGAVGLAEHGRPVQTHLARLSQTGVGLRAELGVHRVARPRRGDLDPLRYIGDLTVQQESHRGRQGAVGGATEQAVRARLHRRVPEYRGGLVVVPHVERLGQATQPSTVGHPQEHQRPRILGSLGKDRAPRPPEVVAPPETDPSCGRDRPPRSPRDAPGLRCAATRRRAASARTASTSGLRPPADC